MASSRRGPSVLVTDSRERPMTRGIGTPRLGSSAIASNRPHMRHVSVDNVLQHSSDIPSGQPRGPPSPRTLRAVARRSSHGTGGLPILASTRTGQQNKPSRTTKVSEKLVLIPETVEEEGAEAEVLSDEDLEQQFALLKSVAEDENRPLRDEELDVLRKRGGVRGKSYAERLPKVERGNKVSRLTAYCTAQSYRLKPTAEFLRTKHEAKAKLYDDCLYTVYHLPLLAGVDGYRIRSRPILKTPGTGKTVLDLEIERSERRDYHEGYFDDVAYDGHDSAGSPHDTASEDRGRSSHHYMDDNDNDNDHDHDYPVSPMDGPVTDAKNFAEMFIFSYGVVVFWNFTENQEKDILADLTFVENETGVSLVTRPLDESDFETEQFHFEYSQHVKRPRVFNDMITLLPRSDHMIKLAISHSIAQSTKLCLFEERMSETMLSAEHVPKRLALTGELNMTRTEIVKIVGRLFKSRVDINLSSNILDVPNFFWESEPTLHPLYVAVREYLEIDPRIRVLNERCRVFLDLAEILCDSDADSKMSSITWIIIILIAVSIVVTVSEVLLRFGMLVRAGDRDRDGGDGGDHAAAVVGSAPRLLHLPGLPDPSSPAGAGVASGVVDGLTIEQLRAWSAALTERERAAVCGAEYVGMTFSGV